MKKFVLIFLLIFQSVKSQTIEDELICQIKFDFAIKKDLSTLPINDIIVEIGKTFIDTKYVSNVLDSSEAEKLIINMQALDCVSFYENCIAMAIAIKNENYLFTEYLDQLKNIRYRNGTINGYASRLHYTSDYFFDNNKRNNFKIVTENIIDKKYLKLIPTPINFMSTHRSLYKHLKDEVNFNEIKNIENEINKRRTFYIPKEFIKFAELQNGDIVGITTSIKGLDVSHTGIIFNDNGILKLLHASQNNKKVEVSSESLIKYLTKNKSQAGIIVARVK